MFWQYSEKECKILPDLLMTNKNEVQQPISCSSLKQPAPARRGGGIALQQQIPNLPHPPSKFHPSSSPPSPPPPTPPPTPPQPNPASACSPTQKFWFQRHLLQKHRQPHTRSNFWRLCIKRSMATPTRKVNIP